MNYWRRYIGDYLRDTIHLTMLQDCAYTRLLDAYYSTEKPLPIEVEKLYPMARANTPEERWAVDTIVPEFFRKTKRGWIHSRVEREIKHLKKILKKRVSAGKQGGRPRKTEKAYALQGGETISPPSPAPAPAPAPTKEVVVEVSSLEKQNIKPLVRPRASDDPSLEGFQHFWEIYPRHEKKLRAKSAWRRLSLEDRRAAYAGVLRWKKSGRWEDEQFIPHPASYLNDRRWTDDIPQKESVSDQFRRDFRKAIAGMEPDLRAKDGPRGDSDLGAHVLAHAAQNTRIGFGQSDAELRADADPSHAPKGD